MNIDFRKAANNDFERERLFQINNSAALDKIMENVRDRVAIKNSLFNNKIV